MKSEEKMMMDIRAKEEMKELRLYTNNVTMFWQFYQRNLNMITRFFSTERIVMKPL